MIDNFYQHENRNFVFVSIVVVVEYRFSILLNRERKSIYSLTLPRYQIIKHKIDDFCRKLKIEFIILFDCRGFNYKYENYGEEKKIFLNSSTR